MILTIRAQQMDTTIAYYNFDSLSAGNLYNNDLWKTTLAGTTVDVKVEANYSYDGSKALHFTQNGGGVNASGNRIMDTLFPNFNYADSGTYYIYFDIKREYWGSEFGVAYDQNNDGMINQSGNSEKAIRFKSAQNGGSSLYTPNGSAHTSATSISSGWNTVEIKFESGAFNGSGRINVRFKSVGTSTWTTLFTNIVAGIDTSLTTVKNPAMWNHVFFHFTGSSSGVDNLEFWKIAKAPPPPNNAPSDLLLAPDTIRENQASHTLVGYFQTIDLDSMDTHTYSFVSGIGDGDNSDFMITDSTLWSSILFDYEDTTMKYIRVKTTDQDGGFFDKAIVIYILDENEVNPGFVNTSKLKMEVYPNPAKDVVLMNFEEGASLKTIKLFSVDGRMVKELSAKGNRIKLDIQGLDNGIYFVVIEDSNGNKMSKKVQILK